MKRTLQNTTPFFVGAGLVAAGVGLSFYLATGERLESLRGLFDTLGPWADAAFIATVALWSLTTVPAIPLMSLGGLVFGPALGAAYSLLGTTLGATITFWTGRRWGKGPLRRLEDRYATVRKVLGVVEHHPVLAVGFVRAIPAFPLTLLNYGFGATRVRFRLYISMAVLMTAPGAAFYAGLADGIRRAIREGGVNLGTVAWVVVPAVAAIALSAYFKRRFR